MEMPANLQLSLQKGDLVIFVDLTHAYLHVPIHPSNSVSSAFGCSCWISGLEKPELTELFKFSWRSMMQLEIFSRC